MSTVEELRRVLKGLADSVDPKAANAIRQRIAQIERDIVARSHQQRR